MSTDTTQTPTRTKSVDYSYATSPNAKRFGFYKTGCWTVSVENENGMLYLSGHATEKEATQVAEKMPEDRSRLYKAFR